MIGHGVVVAGTDATSTLQLARGSYELALHFDVHHAEVVEYTVTCGAQTIPGHVGETFDAYRTRRLAELRAQAERDRQVVSGVAGALVGSVAPDVHAHAAASSPAATATADANVSGQAVGAAAGDAVASATVAPPAAELAYGDVGAGRLNARVDLALDADTACTVAATSDEGSVAAGYDLTRIHDLDAEANERRIAATAGAHVVRGQLTAQLQLEGADPDGLRRRREAEAQAKAAAEAERIRIHAEAQAKLDAERAARDRARAEADAERLRVHAEAQAKLDAEAHLRAQATLEIQQRRVHAALDTRGYLIAYLAGECHADIHKREREREAAAAAEEQRRIRIQIELDARAKLEANLRAERDAREAREAQVRADRDAKLRAEREAHEAERARRIQVALGVRGELTAYLVTIGAHQRPPMPDPIAEVPGPAPFDGAQWISGHWQWSGAQWAWTAGGWHDTMTFAAAGSAGGAVISVGAATAAVAIEPPPVTDPTITIQADYPVTTIHTEGSASTSVIRDHRSQSSGEVVRDHRTQSQTPVIRDHRTSGSTSTSTSTTGASKSSSAVVRDHRTH